MENPAVQNPTPNIIPTNPEHPLYQPPAQEPQKNSTTLFTLISLAVLALIIIATIYLYFQNKKLASNNAPKLQNTLQNQAETKAQAQNVSKEDAQKLAKYGVVCKRFTSVEQALKTPEIACGLDLSNQKLSSLPSGISKLTNLNQIDLSNNNFSTFPTELLKLPNLYSIDLSNNQITTVPSEVFQDQSLQNLNLSQNPVKNRSKSSTGSDSAGLHIEY